MTIFVMFFIELMAARCDFTGGNKRQSEDSQATRYPAQLTERGCSPIAEMLHLSEYIHSTCVGIVRRPKMGYKSPLSRSCYATPKFFFHTEVFFAALQLPKTPSLLKT